MNAWVELGAGASSLAFREGSADSAYVRAALAIVHTSEFDGAITYEVDACSLYSTAGDAELSVRGAAASLDEARALAEQALTTYEATIAARVLATELAALEP